MWDFNIINSNNNTLYLYNDLKGTQGTFLGKDKR